MRIYKLEVDWNNGCNLIISCDNGTIKVGSIDSSIGMPLDLSNFDIQAQKTFQDGDIHSGEDFSSNQKEKYAIQLQSPRSWNSKGQKIGKK